MQKATLNQAHQFLNLIAQSGITKPQLQVLLESGRFSELLREFIEAATPDPTTYQVMVDTSMTLADMIAAGEYDWVNEDITQENFPLPEVTEDGPYRQAPVELQLVHFGREMTTKQILAKLDEQGLRPATLPELCALGAQHPELQRKHFIMALGSEWRGQGGDVNVPYLCGSDGGRRLHLGWDGPQSRWGDDCRFLAASK